MTSDEIIKALRCCEDGDCTDCNLRSDKQHCQTRVLGSAADLIERLEKEKAALLERIKIFKGCNTCKNYNPMCYAEECDACGKKCPCASCPYGSNWKWKGLGEEK